MKEKKKKFFFKKVLLNLKKKIHLRNTADESSKLMKMIFLLKKYI